MKIGLVCLIGEWHMDLLVSEQSVLESSTYFWTSMSWKLSVVKNLNHLTISLCYILVAICMGVALMLISWGSNIRLYWRWENNKTQYPTNQFKRLSLLAQTSNLVQMIAFLIRNFLQQHSPNFIICIAPPCPK